MDDIFDVGFGDMVTIQQDGKTIGQGVIKGRTHDGKWSIWTTFGDGWGNAPIIESSGATLVEKEWTRRHLKR